MGEVESSATAYFGVWADPGEVWAKDLVMVNQ